MSSGGWIVTIGGLLIAWGGWLLALWQKRQLEAHKARLREEAAATRP